MRKQKGFTAFELIIVISCVVTVIALCTVGVVGVHFIAKFW